MYKNKITAFVGGGLLLMAACSKMDEYKSNYIPNNSEIIYAGKVDSLKVRSGKNRVLITGLFTADPKVTTCRIYWDSRVDSLSIPVVHNGNDSLSQIITGLSEGRHNFEVITFDANGNRSVTVTGAGVVYGAKYQSNLVNRPIASAELLANGSTSVTWADFDTSSGAKLTVEKYTDITDKEVTVRTPVRETVTTLPNFKAGSRITYQTIFLPDATCIDTFYVDWTSVGVRADITNQYLSNMGPGYQRDAFDGRWGTLAAPWITNAAAKNKGGLYGGYTADEGGTINWETWGNTPVVDGILYQPTSKELPAGNYIVSFDYYSEIQSNSSVYVVAASGGDGIPVLANLASALGYSSIYNGANVGTTGPSKSEAKTFTFTLSTPQVVSLGILGNLVGNGNPGSYFRLNKIRLFSN
jgi:hypothetical protein